MRSFLLLALLCSPLSPRADSLDEDRVKAGFILNFTKYATWPAASLGTGALRVCSPVQQALSGELRQLQGRQVQGHEISVRLAFRLEDWRNCQVLFIPASEWKEYGGALAGIARLSVLTISDSPDFIAAGGMIGLKQSDGRIRFDINLGSVRRAGLNLSSNLLKLADEVLQ